MDVDELVERHGPGGAIVILAIAYVLYVVHLWMGFNRVVDWWVVVLFGFYMVVGLWDLIGVYFGGFALRALFVENDVWAGFAGIAVMLLVIIALKLKEIRDRCT